MGEQSAQSLEMLRANHMFPGSYTFKVIGENSSAFRKAVEAAVKLVLGAGSTLTVGVRESAQGHHQALSVRADLDSAEDVLAVYAALKELRGVKFLV